MITCPLCDWQTEEAQRIPAAPDVATALGLPPDVMQGFQQHQEFQRVERVIEQHLRTHDLLEVMTALITARRERDVAIRRLAALQAEVNAT